MPVPPKSIQNAGKRALKERQKWVDSGAEPPLTGVGIARARDLANGENLSIRTLKRMISFLSRHEKNNKPGERDSKGRLTKGTIGVLAWGGMGALKWARAQVRKAEK